MTTTAGSREPPIGLLSALPQELDPVLDEIKRFRRDIKILGRTIVSGELHGRDVLALVGGVGKAAIAASTAELIIGGSKSIVLTGTAGKMAPGLNIGDMVVATELIHHDLNVTPIYEPGEVPSLGMVRLPAEPSLVKRSLRAVSLFIEKDLTGTANVEHGLILSGDQLLNPIQIAGLRERYPDGLAVEMEGASVAQVCLESGIPFAVIRTISDGGNAETFKAFLADSYPSYATGFIQRYLQDQNPMEIE